MDFTSFAHVRAGNSAVNFKADAKDGRRYLVRFCPSANMPPAALHPLPGCSYVPAAFSGGRLSAADDWEVCAFEWRGSGESADPASPGGEDIAGILEGYLEFSDALARGVENAGMELPAPGDLPPELLPARPIHGDFHKGNFTVRGGRLESVCDLQKLRMGHPCEDILRIFLHEAERTRFWRYRSISALARNLAEAARLSPWPRDAWSAALGLARSRKAARRALKRKPRIVLAAEAFLRSWMYRRFAAELQGARPTAEGKSETMKERP